MRILLSSTRGAGHMGPLLPFARAWRRRGHDVVLAAPRSAASLVRRTGLPYRPFDDPSDAELGPIWSRVPSLDNDEANRVVVGEIFGRLDTRAALPEMLRTVSMLRPDVVVHETAEISSALAAELHGIRCVRVGIGLALSEAWVHDMVAEPIDAFRAELGLPADPHAERLRRSPYLTLVPASLEDPSEPGADAHRFRDPAVDGGAPLPRDWWPGDERPLVYVSFGSVAPTMPLFPGLFRGAIDALAGLEARVLMTIGDSRDPSELGALPPNVRVERWVPQADVMPHAAAMVGHGGSGSTLAAMAAGVPLVVMPLFADQFENAWRVAAVGAGIALPGGADALPALAQSVRRLLWDGGYRAGSRRLAAEMRALPPVDAATAVLAGPAEALAA